LLRIELPGPQECRRDQEQGIGNRLVGLDLHAGQQQSHRHQAADEAQQGKPFFGDPAGQPRAGQRSCNRRHDLRREHVTVLAAAQPVATLVRQDGAGRGKRDQDNALHQRSHIYDCALSSRCHQRFAGSRFRK
jgi:hypothetical protein